MLLIVLVNVLVGALDEAGICIPFKVPRIVPPTELEIELKEILNPLEFLTRIPFTVPDTALYEEIALLVPKFDIVLA